MTHICLNCGFNVEPEQALTIEPFRYDPHVPVFEIDGIPLACAPQIRAMLGSVMLAHGRTLSYAVIAERLGYDGDDPRNLIRVLTCRAKQLVEARGYCFPIERIHSLGLRWRLAGEGIGRPFTKDGGRDMKVISGRKHTDMPAATFA